jgi:hypothetical protein
VEENTVPSGCSQAEISKSPALIPYELTGSYFFGEAEPREVAEGTAPAASMATTSNDISTSLSVIVCWQSHLCYVMKKTFGTEFQRAAVDANKGYVKKTKTK